jgi:exosome complex component CSL4
LNRKTSRTKKLGVYIPGQPVGVIDIEARIAKLKPLKTPPIPKIGDIVIAVVLDHNKDHATVKIIGIEQPNKNINYVELDGLLLLKSRKHQFTIRNYDIIRAKVTADTIPLVLEINDKKLGLIYALCPQCPGELVLKGKKIVCSQCGFIDERKPEEPNWFRKVPS